MKKDLESLKKAIKAWPQESKLEEDSRPDMAKKFVEPFVYGMDFHKLADTWDWEEEPDTPVRLGLALFWCLFKSSPYMVRILCRVLARRWSDGT